MGFQLSSEDFKKTEKKKEQDVGFFESALAGVATGLWNIPKGFVSLGAEIFDIVGDTNTAKDVEEWFDNVNPFDDEAEARTIGKITTALASIGPLAVKGAQLGTRAALLARKALKAKEAGRYLGLAKIDLAPSARGPNSILPWNQPIALFSDKSVAVLSINS